MPLRFIKPVQRKNEGISPRTDKTGLQKRKSKKINFLVKVSPKKKQAIAWATTCFPKGKLAGAEGNKSDAEGHAERAQSCYPIHLELQTMHQFTWIF